MGTARTATKTKSKPQSKAKASPKSAAKAAKPAPNPARNPASNPAKPALKPASKPAAKPAQTRAAKSAPERMTFAQVMSELKAAGAEKTRKIYATHGAPEPMFGVQFGVLFKMQRRVRVDHDLALALWDTGNFDARCFAMKIADPAQITPATLDRWARAQYMRGLDLYIASLAVESPHGAAKGREWLASSDPVLRARGWTLAGVLSNRDESIPDDWFAARIADIEKTIHTVTDAERSAMNGALVAIGGRNPAMRKLVTAAAKRIGDVQSAKPTKNCKPTDIVGSIDKSWERSTKMKFASPAAHERSHESMRTRC